MTSQEYVYKVAEVVRVVDGDSYWFRLDTGFRQQLLVNVRLLGFDTPERRKGTPREREQAKVAHGWAEQMLREANGQIWVRTEPDPDDFGRWLGDVWLERGDGQEVHLGDALRKLNLASVWPTRWRNEFDL